jgi:hypothetical protein
MLIEMNGEILDINDPVGHSFDQYRNIVKNISDISNFSPRTANIIFFIFYFE